MNARPARPVLPLIPLLCALAARGGDGVLLHIDGVPDHGIAMADLDLTHALRWCGVSNARPGRVRALLLPGETPVPAQFIPADDFDGTTRIAGTVILKLPSPTPAVLRLDFDGPDSGSGDDPAGAPFQGVVTSASCRVFHDPGRQGGLPSRFEFPRSGKVLDRFRWNDRVHDPEAGSFLVANDPKATVACVSRGPLATVIRIRARYVRPGAEPPASRPEAVYDWCYLNDSPLVRVAAVARQQPGKPWAEAHFLELNFPPGGFAGWIGGTPPQRGTFGEEEKSFPFDDWGALTDGPCSIALLDGGRALFWQNRKGGYLQAHGDTAWNDWGEPERRWSAWLRLAESADPGAEAPAAARQLPTRARVTPGLRRVEEALAAARAALKDGDRAAWRKSAAGSQLAAAGDFDGALKACAGDEIPGVFAVRCSTLGALVRRTDGGIGLLSLYDLAAGHEHVAAGAEPLFDLHLRHAATGEDLHAFADRGWGETRVARRLLGGGLELRWSRPADERLAGMTVTAAVSADGARDALTWTLSVTAPSGCWALREVVFPKIALREPGPRADLFLPRAAGQVESGAWRRKVSFGGRYPSGWTAMPYMAAYAADGGPGLYVAMHDPRGSVREVRAVSRPDAHLVVASFEHPVPNLGTPGQGFELPGAAVTEGFRGDWFDAALIYRDWVRREAAWYPRLGRDGRADTPAWVRELCVWGQGGGDPKSGLPLLREFREKMGLPVGFHWYNWHQIPFDNDYPHYFPPDEGFGEAVAALQERGIHVMPYINGRLWDTRDRGTNDFEFTARARAAATKDERGEPYIETYGSRESDGSKVRLAAMCPSTAVWSDKVRENVLRLMNEYGVDGVYIDQVAAASPCLCMDPTHGHPLGGGDWWVDSYGRMLGALRAALPPGRMLTTECNAEPYANRFDAYLTWHWQYDGQVPAFPAVYGGALQMFGRAYRGGPTRDLALRMKAGQQLVYGEQIGWLDPAVVREADNFAFLRAAVHLRHRLCRYFYAGQMGRPPLLQGGIPMVTADWQWDGVWPVTTPAAMAGAWELPRERRAVLLFANVSDAPVRTRVALDAAAHGVPGAKVRLAVMTPDGAAAPEESPGRIDRALELPPRSVLAWELSPR